MALRIVQVDAFTRHPFSGNPAAVCVLPKPADASWMQAVAREMNLSETAFLVRQADGFGLRWFTPALEVALCGHATLASAHVLWEDAHIGPEAQAHFSTKSGLLTAERRGEWIELDFPAKPDTAAELPPGLVEALRVRPTYVGRSEYDLILELGSEAEVRSIKPDFGRLAGVPVRGIIVTSLWDSGEYDLLSRFFAPAAGVDEDPVTGSSHCTLAPFWGRRLRKSEMVGYQASTRGGVVRVRLAGEDRVKLGGQAVTVLTGELLPAQE